MLTCAALSYPTTVQFAAFGVAVIIVFLLNNYDDIQSKFKQYIDFNQLFAVSINTASSRPSYFIQRAGMLGLTSGSYSMLSGTFTLPCMAPVRGIVKYMLESYALPITLIITLLLCFAALYIRRYKQGLPFYSSQFYHALWQIILLCYTSVNSAGMSLLHCTSVGSVRVLEVDNSIACTGQSYTTFVIIGVALSLLASVVLPAFIIYSHAKHKLVYWHLGSLVDRELQPDKTGAVIPENSPQKPSLKDPPAIPGVASKPLKTIESAHSTFASRSHVASGPNAVLGSWRRVSALSSSSISEAMEEVLESEDAFEEVSTAFEKRPVAQTLQNEQPLFIRSMSAASGEHARSSTEVRRLIHVPSRARDVFIMPGAPVETEVQYIAEFRAANDRLAKLLASRPPDVTFVDGVPAVGVDDSTAIATTGGAGMYDVPHSSKVIPVMLLVFALYVPRNGFTGMSACSALLRRSHLLFLWCWPAIRRRPIVSSL